MQRYDNYLADYLGRPLAGASVKVQNYPSLTQATYYLQNSTAIPLTAPITSGPDGSFGFYCADGHYQIIATGVGGQTVTIPDIIFDDPANDISNLASTYLKQTDAATIYETQAAASAFATNASLSAPSGSSLVGHQPAGAGAVATTVQVALQRISLEVDNFKQVGDTDDLACINRAFAYAITLVPAPVLKNGVWVIPYGGAIVQLSARNYVTTSGMVEVPVGVILQGKGKNLTTLNSSYNGQIIRNADQTAAGVYGYTNGGLAGFTVYGDRTKSSQVGIDLLRLNYAAVFEGVDVFNCGGNGINLRGCIGLIGINIESLYNVGKGFFFDQGVSTWAGMVADGHPSNACNFINCHGAMNDAAGVSFGIAKDCLFQGVTEYNYYSSATGTGWNVEFITDATGNSVTVWSEGPVLTGALSNTTTSASNINYLRNCFFTPSGLTTTGHTRAAIATVGIIEVSGYAGLNNSYPAVNSSTAPFRCTKATGGKIVYRGYSVYGAAANGLHIEDENGNLGNVALYAYQEVQNASTKIDYATKNNFYEAGSISDQWFKTTGINATTWETTPWLRFNNFLRGIEFDDASAGHYAGVYYRTTTPEGSINAYPGSLCIVGGGANNNTYQKVSGTGSTGWLPLASNKVGSFTLAANTITTVAEVAVLSANTRVLLTPTNAAAATLMQGTKSLYVSAKTANTSFGVSTADGTAAAGTETFDYVIVN